MNDEPERKLRRSDADDAELEAAKEIIANLAIEGEPELAVDILEAMEETLDSDREPAPPPNKKSGVT